MGQIDLREWSEWTHSLCTTLLIYSKRVIFAIRPTAQRICSILYSDHNIAYRVVFMSVGKCHRRSDLQCLVVRGSV